jgi:glutaminyl-tRNA synthetase
MIDRDLESGKVQQVVTRFPPGPNGFLHIGHAKAFCLDFGLAEEYPNSRCHLRFDDTNPEADDPRYVQSIQEDIRWMGFDWGEYLYYASDYYPRLCEDAERLIEMGKAYVCELSEDEFRACRGTVNESGKASPYRDRSVQENLDLFRRMRGGEFDEGSQVLRAKVDMASPNMKMRDPPIYRIRKTQHYRTGDKWCIYPIYDFAHPLSDAYEGITHSLCSLEFENNRELYDWYLDTLGYDPRPYQTEFARLRLNYTIVGKRKLANLVEKGLVRGWDDPRMPTLAAFRRRGVRPQAIRTFCERIGMAKSNSVVDLAQLEHAIRDDLNHEAPRMMAVLDPLKVVITNYPEGREETLDASLWPHDVPKEGSRKVCFGREIFIERDDFRKDPPKGFYRLSPGAEVRLRYAYFLRCDEVIEDASGKVVELRCSYDPATRGGNAPEGRKVKGTLHWVHADSAVNAEVRLYDRLFQEENPDLGKGTEYLDCLNPDSLKVLQGCKLEAGLRDAKLEDRFQFERQGYFCLDADSRDGALVFNRTVSLKDSWARRKKAPSGKLVPQAKTAATPSPRGPRDYESDLSPENLARYRDFRSQGKVSEEAARALVDDAVLACLFQKIYQSHANPGGLANLLVNDLSRELKGREEALPFGAGEIGELVDLLDEGVLSSKIAKKVLGEMLAKGGSPRAIVEEKGWRAITSSTELEPFVDAVLEANPGNVEKYRAGKKGLLGFFTGQIMKKTGGKADPHLVGVLLAKKLDA